MNAQTTRDGFAAYVLRSAHAEIHVVPALGAKITSLRALRTGREWLWWAPDGRGLHRNRVGDPFEQGPMAGADDCLPTVAPCGDLPDHGEVWCRACEVDPSAWKQGVLTTALTLSCAPLRLERAFTLRDRTLTIAYRLTNLSTSPQPWLWAWHPLFQWQAGDCVELPAEVTTLKVEAQLGLELSPSCAWPSPRDGFDLARLTVPSGNPWYLKLFTDALRERCVRIVNEEQGERLTLRFEGRDIDFLGLWFTRGGWNGFDHFAIEPTNHPADTPRSHPQLAAHESRSWTVSIEFGDPSECGGSPPFKSE